MSGEQTVDIDTSDTGDPGGSSPLGRSPGRRRLVVGLIAALVVIAFVLWWFQPQALFIDDVVDEQFPLSPGPSHGADAAADPDPAGSTGSAATAGPDGEVVPDPEAGPATAGPATADPEAGPATAGPATADGETADRNDTHDTDATPNHDTDATPTPDEPPATTGPVTLRSGDFSSRNRYEVSGTATAFALDDTERILRLEDFESTNGPDLFVYLTVADASATDAELDADLIDLGVLTGNIGNQNYVIPPEVDLELYDTVVIWCRRFATSFGVADLMVSTN